MATGNVAKEEFSDDTCVICCHKSDLFCVGQCDHPVCFECGTRMRVLCQSKECSICRTDLSLVYVVHFNKKVESFYNNLVLKSKNKFIINDLGREYGIKFENREAASAVQDLLAHVCTVCNNEREFDSFDLLSRHMRREHELFYCELCVEFLNLFSWERKCYTRADLARHKRTGDPDDKSHKGHPLCQFCDQRFLDDDYLYRHLRRDHYYCHFCDVDGKNKFYTDVNKLKEHFKAEHFLCEIGHCKNEELGVSFRHELDFKAHKATVHARDLQKSDLKKELQVNVGFNFGPAPFRERLAQQRQHEKTRPRDRQHERPASSQTLPDSSSHALPQQLQPSADPSSSNFRLAKEDFPSLLNKNAIGQQKQQQRQAQADYQNGPRQRGKLDNRQLPSHLLANVVDSRHWSSFSTSLGENDFPALTNMANAAAVVLQKDKSGGGGRSDRHFDNTYNAHSPGEYRRRRDSRSASPPGSSQPARNQPRTGLTMIDDDEDPRLRRPQQIEASDNEETPEEPEKPSQPSSSANLWGKPKIGGLSQNEFPALPMKPQKNKTTKKSAAKNAQISSNAAAAAPETWSRKLAVEKPAAPSKRTENQQQQQSTSSKQIGINQPSNAKSSPNFDIDFFVALPKNKARARIIAQSKQKQSPMAMTLADSGEPPDPPGPPDRRPDSNIDLSTAAPSTMNVPTDSAAIAAPPSTTSSHYDYLPPPPGLSLNGQFPALLPPGVPPPPGFSTVRDRDNYKD